MKKTMPVRDPIKTLVELGCGRDVDTVIVAGKTLIRGGRSVNLDEEAIYRKAATATQNFWRNVPNWHWAGHDVDRIMPPSFPTHRQAE